MADEIQIEILADGTIKSSTGKIGGVNHQSAEAFLADVEKKAAGETKRTRRGSAPAKAHHHHHNHQHN